MNRSTTRGPGRALVSLLILLATLLWSAAAGAEDRRLAVYIEGPGAEGVRASVLSVVAAWARVIEPRAFADALAKQGQRGPIGAALTSPRQRDKALDRLRKAAGAAGADALIAGRTRKGADGLRVWLVWLSPRGADLEVDEEVPQRGDQAARRAALDKVLRAPLGKLSPPSSAPRAAPAEGSAPREGPAPEKSSTPEKDATPENAPPAASAAADTSSPSAPAPPAAVDHPARAPHQVGTALVVLGLEFALGGRRFAYTDGLTPNARDYDVLGPPMPAVSAEVYPAAGTRVPVVRDLGLMASYARAFGLGSKTRDGKAVDTSWDRLLTGLRFRLRPGRDEGPVLGVRGGFGMIRFDFTTTDKALAASVPDVAYMFLRGGLDARIPFWRLALLLEADYQGALSAGEVFDRFRGARVGGIDAGVGLAFALGKGFEARLGAQYTRYFYAFDPIPGDAYVAGGALDEFLTLGLGATYAY